MNGGYGNTSAPVATELADLHAAVVAGDAVAVPQVAVGQARREGVKELQHLREFTQFTCIIQPDCQTVTDVFPPCFSSLICSLSEMLFLLPISNKKYFVYMPVTRGENHISSLWDPYEFHQFTGPASHCSTC